MSVCPVRELINTENTLKEEEVHEQEKEETLALEEEYEKCSPPN